MKKANEKTNIFEYTDYRKYLKDYYDEMKQDTPYFSFRYFSKLAGFTSPNYLKLIIDATRNLSAKAIAKFIKALKLSAKEARYFRVMVMMNQAPTTEEKDYYLRQILKNKVYKTLKPLTQAQYEYYSHWYHIPLRELVGRSDFKNDPKWIAHQFTPSITESQVKEGFTVLEKLGLIEKTNEGSFKQSEQAVSTGDEVTSLAVMNYHRKMIQMGMESMDRFQGADRDISALTLGVKKQSLGKIKQLIQEFRKELIAISNEEGAEFEDIVQVNFQMFPLVVNRSENE
jgi:uncharacterized protein (TIGR02147 family)